MKRILNYLQFINEGVKTGMQHLLEEVGVKQKEISKKVEFPSGVHSAAAAKLDDILKPELSDIEKFIADNKGSLVEIVLSAGESQVPNRDAEKPKVATETQPDGKVYKNVHPRLNPGELSKMRYETIQAYMTTWLNSLKEKGVIEEIPEFKTIEPKIGSTPWNPEVDKKDDSKYTQEQFLEVKVRVVGPSLPGDYILTIFKSVKEHTSRTKRSAYNDYNTSLFYNYSRAAASVLGVDPKTLPGALLTMNRSFNLKESIDLPNFKLGPFTAKITPINPKEVDVVVLKSVQGDPVDIADEGEAWKALIADKYELQMVDSSKVPFKEGSDEFRNAWIFAFYYIIGSYADDWKYISNKPEGINWKYLEGKLSNSGVNKKWDSNINKTEESWKKWTPNWYAGQVKKFYKAQKEAEG